MDVFTLHENHIVHMVHVSSSTRSYREPGSEPHDETVARAHGLWCLELSLDCGRCSSLSCHFCWHYYPRRELSRNGKMKS